MCNGVSYSPFSLEDEDPVGVSEAAASESLPEGHWAGQLLRQV